MIKLADTLKEVLEQYLKVESELHVLKAFSAELRWWTDTDQVEISDADYAAILSLMISIEITLEKYTARIKEIHANPSDYV